jgi:hypothetical protein
MTGWTSDELSRIGGAEELERGSAWFRGAQSHHQAHIRAGGVQKDVDLIETDEGREVIDAAYQAKYSRRYPTIVPRIVTPEAQAATLKLVPR